MDLVDLIADKKFLGQDFLTWLCYESENEELSFVTHDNKRIGVLLDYDMTLVCENEEGCNKISFSGSGSTHPHTLPEVKMALASGKKVEQARILLIVDEDEFVFKATGSLLEISGLKLPKTGNSDYEDEIGGAVLERIHLIKTATIAFDSVFKSFLELRVSPKWPKTIDNLRDWLQKY